MNFDAIIPVQRQNGGDDSRGNIDGELMMTISTPSTNRNTNHQHHHNRHHNQWRLRNKRGSSLDNELSFSSRSFEGDLGVDIDATTNNSNKNVNITDAVDIDINDSMNNENDLYVHYGGGDYRTQSSLSENGVLGSGEAGGGFASTLPAGVGGPIATIKNCGSINNNSFRFSNDEIRKFCREETLDSVAAEIITSGNNASHTSSYGGGIRSRATTPGDEQIFQESVESLQIRIGRLLSCEEMCDMHFLIGSGPHAASTSAFVSSSSNQMANNVITSQLNHHSTTGHHQAQQHVINQTSLPPMTRKLRIPAHRLIMASASPVFKQLLFNSATNRMVELEEDIEINDIDPAAFLEFLRFAYTDSARLNKDNVVGVLTCARRYEIVSLERQCVQYIEKCLTQQACLAVWLAARAYGDQELERAARKSVQHYAKETLLSSDFLRADLTAICELLADDLLNADEIVVFRALTRWAKQACLRATLCPTRANVRAFIGPALNLIRFPLMTEEQLQRVVAAEGILDDELLRALVHCSRNWSRVSNLITSGTSMSFSNEKRAYQKLNAEDSVLHEVYRFASFEDKLSNRFVNRSLNFITNKRIWLAGVGLFAPRKGSNFILKIWIRVRRANYVAQTWLSPMDQVEKTESIKWNEGTGPIISVKFDQPLQVEANVQYEVAACVTPTFQSSSVRVFDRLQTNFIRSADVHFYYGIEGQYATKVRINRSENVIFNFNWERDNGSHEDSQSDSASNQNFNFIPTVSSEPTTPNPPPRPPPPQEYRRPSRLQRLRRALSFVDRREDHVQQARESGLLEGQIPVLMFYV